MYDYLFIFLREIDNSRIGKCRLFFFLRIKDYRDNGSFFKRRRSLRIRFLFFNYVNYLRIILFLDFYRRLSFVDRRFNRFRGDRGDILNIGNGIERKRSSFDDVNDNKIFSDKEDFIKDV